MFSKQIQNCYQLLGRNLHLFVITVQLKSALCLALLDDDYDTVADYVAIADADRLLFGATAACCLLLRYCHNI